MKRRSGFTALELLVVVAVIGVLVSLLGPAVQAAREAARAAQCKSNLRQLGQAAHQYEAAHRMLPGWLQEGFGKPFAPGETIGDIRNNHVSVIAQMLPFLGQSELYDSLNQSHVRIPSGVDTSAPEWDCVYTAIRRPVSVFLCPSDSRKLKPGNNYRGCFGSGPAYKQNAEYPDSGNGIFSQLVDVEGGEFPLRLAIVHDGLAQTAMFSERLTGGGDPGRFDSRRDATVPPGPHAKTADEALVYCRRLQELELQTPARRYSWCGWSWISTGVAHTLYTHSFPPNAGISDCVFFVMPDGVSTARSEHPGGVHVTFADGSARFVSDSVNLGVWRALATRNGNETVLTGSF